MSSRHEKIATALIRVTGTIMLVSFGAMAVTIVLMLIFDDATSTGFAVTASGGTFAGCGGLALAAATSLRVRRHEPLMWAVIVASTIAAMSLGVLLWADRLDDEHRALLAKIGVTMLIVCLASMHYVAFADLETDSRPLHWARWILIPVTWTFTALVVLTIWAAEAMESIAPPSVLVGYFFLLTAIGAVTLIGSLLMRLAFRFEAQRRRARVESMPSRVMLELLCPQCSAELTLPAGAGRCPGCNFGVTIEIEEPRCECGYLLYRLHGTTCPECGAIVRSQDSFS